MHYTVYVQTLPGCPHCQTVISRLRDAGHTVEVLDDAGLAALENTDRRSTLHSQIHLLDDDRLPVVFRDDKVVDAAGLDLE